MDTVYPHLHPLHTTPDIFRSTQGFLVYALHIILERPNFNSSFFIIHLLGSVWITGIAFIVSFCNWDGYQFCALFSLNCIKDQSFVHSVFLARILRIWTRSSLYMAWVVLTLLDYDRVRLTQQTSSSISTRDTTAQC